MARAARFLAMSAAGAASRFPERPGLWRRLAARGYGAARWLEGRRRPPAEPVPGVAVLSIGNLEVGGAGKTPCALWWAETLAPRRPPVAVVYRPWGAAAPGAPSDEGALYRERLPAGVRLVAAGSKREGTRTAAAGGARTVIVDDGFSHRALARDLDLLLLDARRPFGNRHLLPAGPLREPPGAVARADAVVLTRADRATPGEIAEAERELRSHGFAGPILRAAHRVLGVRENGRAVEAAGAPVLCASGLARPGELAEAARGAGLEVRGERRFADHHRFREREWAALEARARALGARILVTAKDAVRLTAERRAAVWVLEMTWAWLESAGEPESLVHRLLGAGSR